MISGERRRARPSVLSSRRPAASFSRIGWRAAGGSDAGAVRVRVVHRQMVHGTTPEPPLRARGRVFLAGRMQADLLRARDEVDVSGWFRGRPLLHVRVTFVIPPSGDLES